MAPGPSFWLASVRGRGTMVHLMTFWDVNVLGAVGTSMAFVRVPLAATVFKRGNIKSNETNISERYMGKKAHEN